MCIRDRAEQDRARWDRSLYERGVRHLGDSATGDRWTRWHLEAGIAFEHTRAPSLAETRWGQIVAYYDALAAIAPGPVVALNRGLALAEEPNLAGYSFLWAALADLERRAGRPTEAATFYRRAMAGARSPAERLSYERRLQKLES